MSDRGDENLRLHLEDTKVSFNLRRLAVLGRTPIKLGAVHLPDPKSIPSSDGRIDYKIKESGSTEYQFGSDVKPEDVLPFLEACQDFINAHGLEWKDRSAILHIFTNPVDAGRSQNPIAGMWHFDPNMGDVGDYFFNASSVMPTEFTNATYDATRPKFPSADTVVETEPNVLYFSSIYGMHRGLRAKARTERIFMYISFSAKDFSASAPSPVAWRYDATTKRITPPLDKAIS